MQNYDIHTPDRPSGAAGFYATVPMVLTGGQVAHLLGMSEESFRRKVGLLERLHRFPPKLPGHNKWSRPAVERWIETNGETHQPPAPLPSSPEAARLAGEAAALEGVYAP